MIKRWLAPLLDVVRRARKTTRRNLKGDRDIEWSFVAARIGAHVAKGTRVLDVGCGTGVLSLAAAGMGGHVLAIDLMPQQFSCPFAGFDFRMADVSALNASDGPFDVVINCSTIEHVGLGGRYNSRDAPDGDLDAMERLARLMRPGGYMLLTLPVGQDAVFRPLHRVYGGDRLPRIIGAFRVIEEQYFHKPHDNTWRMCSSAEAMAEAGGPAYYALGCMVLQK